MFEFRFYNVNGHLIKSIVSDSFIFFNFDLDSGKLSIYLEETLEYCYEFDIPCSFYRFEVEFITHNR